MKRVFLLFVFFITSVSYGEHVKWGEKRNEIIVKYLNSEQKKSWDEFVAEQNFKRKEIRKELKKAQKTINEAFDSDLNNEDLEELFTEAVDLQAKRMLLNFIDLLFLRELLTKEDFELLRQDLIGVFEKRAYKKHQNKSKAKRKGKKS